MLVLGAVALVLLNERSPAPDVREIPFGAVIREHELRSAPAQSPEGGTGPAAAAGPAAGDSLTLAVVVTDTLWMQVRLDEGSPREYLAPPGFRTSWKARDRFLLTVGNTRAATWTLNGKRLGPLRSTGTVARNVELSRATLAGL